MENKMANNLSDKQQIRPDVMGVIRAAQRQSLETYPNHYLIEVPLINGRVETGSRIEPDLIEIGPYQVRHMRHGFLHGSLTHKPRNMVGKEDNETMKHPRVDIGRYVRLDLAGYNAVLLATDHDVIVKYDGREVPKVLRADAQPARTPEVDGNLTSHPALEGRGFGSGK